ncbi:hypothetical protein [Sulfuriferula nivalis]|uniref:Zinc ribbon domain-containing protein n=1 Tax=Sulfuriferula nivalis TaxID=2675298 RepID=A0A809SAK3_9PROT|nr:hypothetical protein [Sulfuriferula nivalis]BBP01672.1 hypothetical protein SFSGTM_23800 [Sulfuriferula nivalis]
MSDLVCPHCHTELLHNANTCSGCQAEVEYGVPSSAFILLLIAAIFTGVATRNMTLGGWVALTTVLVGGSVVLNMLFANRIAFKR